MNEQDKKSKFIAHCPVELGSVARNEFVRIVDELAKLKRLNTLDVASVAMYANAYAGWLEAIAAIKEFGPIVRGASGYPNQSPYVALANQHVATMMRCSSELCLSPASRNKNLGERNSTGWDSWDGGPGKELTPMK
jgi:P27 family predicted phage terminase small subunit